MDGIFDAVGREGVLGDAEMMSWVDKNRKWLDAYAGFKVQMAKERSKFGRLPGKGVGMICGKHACSHALAPVSRGRLIWRAQSALFLDTPHLIPSCCLCNVSRSRWALCSLGLGIPANVCGRRRADGCSFADGSIQ